MRNLQFYCLLIQPIYLNYIFLITSISLEELNTDKGIMIKIKMKSCIMFAVGEIGKLKSDKILKYTMKKIIDRNKDITERINITPSNIKPILLVILFTF